MRTIPLQTDALIAEAQRRASFVDLGPEWILDALSTYVTALSSESGLTASGETQMSESIIRKLVNRLRMIEAIRVHPEILKEDIRILATIVGLPRTGSTMLQRILNCLPQINGVQWWELQNFSPFPGEAPGKPIERISVAKRMVDEWLQSTPEFAAIHPLSATEVDEESILLHNMFCGMMEFASPIPSFVAWQNTATFEGPYADLRMTLQFLQWQNPNRRGKSWILKAPEHLLAPAELLKTFPDCKKIIVTHRDPRQVLPSICSMHYTLHRLAVAEPSREKIGIANLQRWAPALDRLTVFRNSIGNQIFTDISYFDLIKDPVGQVRSALSTLNLNINEEVEAAIRTWLDENAREHRASHVYALEDFGLTSGGVRECFANYIDRFIDGAERL